MRIKISVVNHDCEDEPTGFGEEHLDITGEQWRAAYVHQKEKLADCDSFDSIFFVPLIESIRFLYLEQLE